MSSSYQQVEGGAASDGNGFDRPAEFRGVSHLAGTWTLAEAPETPGLVLVGVGSPFS